MMAESAPIFLTLLNGTGYIFEIDAYMKLRKKYRIVGALVGTSTYKGWSINDSTLPVELTIWETQLLLELGLAVLVSKSESLLKQLPPSAVNQFHQQYEKRLSEQVEPLKTERRKEILQNLDNIISGKREKLLQAGIPPEDFPNVDIQLEPEAVLAEISSTITHERKNCLLQIASAHPVEHDSRLVHLRSKEQTLKYLVFRDLWQRGNYVTCGDSFGADFLIYPGDPLMFHASHLVILLEQPNIKPLDLIVKVRLAVSVNKICLLAYLDESPSQSNGETVDSGKLISLPTETKVIYQSVTWLGSNQYKDIEK